MGWILQPTDNFLFCNAPKANISGNIKGTLVLKDTVIKQFVRHNLSPQSTFELYDVAYGCAHWICSHVKINSKQVPSAKHLKTNMRGDATRRFKKTGQKTMKSSNENSTSIRGTPENSKLSWRDLSSRDKNSTIFGTSLYCTNGILDLL